MRPETANPPESVQSMFAGIITARTRADSGQIESHVMVEEVLGRAAGLQKMGALEDPSIAGYLKSIARDRAVWQGLVNRIIDRREQIKTSADPKLDEQLIRNDLELAEVLGMGENTQIAPYLDRVKADYPTSRFPPKGFVHQGAETKTSVPKGVTPPPLPPTLTEEIGAEATSVGVEPGTSESPTSDVGGTETVIPEEKRAGVQGIVDELRQAGALLDEFRTLPLSDENARKASEAINRFSDLQVKLSEALGLGVDESYQTAQELENEESHLNDMRIDRMLNWSERDGTLEDLGKFLRQIFTGSTPEVRKSLEGLLTRDSSDFLNNILLEREFNRSLRRAANITDEDWEKYDSAVGASLRRSREFDDLIDSSTDVEAIINAFRLRNRAKIEFYRIRNANTRKVGDYERELASKAGMEIFYE